MAYRITSQGMVGAQPIANTETTRNHPIGTIVHAVSDDSTPLAGEFIYLLGAANTVVGLIVTYDIATGATTLSANTIQQNKATAVAMSANVASQYGWYQIAGYATVKKNATIVTQGLKLFQSSTTGRVAGSGVTSVGKLWENATAAGAATVASATSTITVLIQRPFFSGAVS